MGAGWGEGRGGKGEGPTLGARGGAAWPRGGWEEILICIYLGYLSYLYFPKKNSISGINHNFNFIEKPLFQGLVMNLVNPKIILFFVSFFPQFIFHNEWEIKTQFYILGLMFTTIAFVTFVSVLSVLNLTKSQMKLGKQSKNISYLSSAMLLGLSAYFFWEEINYIMELI